MNKHPTVGAGDAWYAADRATFLQVGQEFVVAELSSAATSQGWHIETEQHEEWVCSVEMLQHELRVRAEILRKALAEDALAEFTDVILEYNFRRRGLRIDCILLAPGIITVLEFKRSKLTPADRDQVTNYCINLVEFHRETRRLCDKDGCIVVPILPQRCRKWRG